MLCWPSLGQCDGCKPPGRKISSVLATGPLAHSMPHALTRRLETPYRTLYCPCVKLSMLRLLLALSGTEKVLAQLTLRLSALVGPQLPDRRRKKGAAGWRQVSNLLPHSPIKPLPNPSSCESSNPTNHLRIQSHIASLSTRARERAFERARAPLHTPESTCAWLTHMCLPHARTSDTYV